jgi:hypothetical protein
MKVTTLLSIIEFFVELLVNAAKRHEVNVAEIKERIRALEYEVKENAAEASRARKVADKIAQLIGE